MIPLSILDLSVVTTGTRPSAALQNSIDLARHADALGYVRYWLAEHHNLSSVASPAPDIMIGQIAAVTNRIRVGSGGVMLPNHAPLMVAERFKMLEAAASISGSAARRALMARPPTRCAAGSIAARAMTFSSGCMN